MTFAPLRVWCSCNKTAIITWNEEDICYQCADPSWRYSGSEEGDRLWNCGEPGHYQDGVRTEEIADEQRVQ